MEFKAKQIENIGAFDDSLEEGKEKSKLEKMLDDPRYSLEVCMDE